MFGRKKMYKKGMADAMEAYEGFGKKQEEALAHIREEIRSGNKKREEALLEIKDTLHNVYDRLDAQEKAALYHLNTPYDIKEMEDGEKRLLVAVLHQLAADEGDDVTDDQRAYLRSVQRYLEITNPQMEADLTAVANIDSGKVQRAFLQVVLEFLYLADGVEYSDTQAELLTSFEISEKQKEAIEQMVGQFYNAVGAQGMAERYGYVPEGGPAPNIDWEDTMKELEDAIQRALRFDLGYRSYIITVHASLHRGKSAYLEGEQYKDRSRCERDAEKELQKDYDKIKKEMGDFFEENKSSSYYKHFSDEFSGYLNYAKKKLDTIRTAQVADIINEIKSVLSPTKVLDQMKSKNSTLTRKYELGSFYDYTGSINYEVNDPSEWETGMAKILARAFKTYGYEVQSAAGEIAQDANEKMRGFVDEFIGEAEDCARKEISDPVQTLLNQLRMKLESGEE